ncbi:ganglioside GM2 activator-like [Physella acuta]|uniref:ganglioside GM2 activator-like n=1 Tax=Physella acuta TaxID=109671 RepID=UPI0027DABDC9|nr:ganglioside GM2 activator-like [Physella acuta]
MSAPAGYPGLQLTLPRLTIVIYFTVSACISSIATEIPDTSSLHYVDCGPADKLIQFDHVQVSPLPIQVPGTMFLSMSVNVTSDLPRRVNVYLSLRKYFLGFFFNVPCMSRGIGSCSYENICAMLEAYELTGCPDTFQDFGLNCHSMPGVKPMVMHVINSPNKNQLTTACQPYAEYGDYQFEIKIVEDEGRDLACLQVNFSVETVSHSWLFDS